jgi:hypothetical protein
MVTFYTQYSGVYDNIFASDQTILNFGPYSNKRVYFTQQASISIPFSQPVENIPTAYIGLTAQALWNQFGLVIAGQLAPSNAVTLPGIVGLVAP